MIGPLPEPEGASEEAVAQAVERLDNPQNSDRARSITPALKKPRPGYSIVTPKEG